MLGTCSPTRDTRAGSGGRARGRLVVRVAGEGIRGRNRIRSRGALRRGVSGYLAPFHDWNLLADAGHLAPAHVSARRAGWWSGWPAKAAVAGTAAAARSVAAPSNISPPFMIGTCSRRRGARDGSGGRAQGRRVVREGCEGSRGRNRSRGTLRRGAIEYLAAFHDWNLLADAGHPRRLRWARAGPAGGQGGRRRHPWPEPQPRHAPSRRHRISRPLS